MRFISNLSIRRKIMVTIGLMALGFLGSTWFNAVELKNMLYSERQMKTRHLVEAAASVIKAQYDRYKAGELSEADAQKEALHLISKLRYNETEYFWVNDNRPVILMHPLQPQLNGQDLKTTNEKLYHLFSAFTKTAMASEKGGFYSYEWAKPGTNSTELHPKISYLTYFKPWQWVIGSGIYIDDVNVTFHENLIHNLTKCGLLVLVLFMVALMITNDLTRPMHQVCMNLDRLAHGQTDLEVLYTERKDEVGDIARAMEIFRTNLLEKIQLEENSTRTVEEQAKERRRSMLALADQFDKRVGSIVDSVSGAADLMQAMANTLAQNIETSTEQSSSAASSSEQASASVGSVAAATEELTASIREIASSIARTATATRECASKAHDSQQKLALLQQAIEEIDSVIHSINDVATQTNLLALNATIEAARAGELGKGFSVVASEVKQLANKTHNMTEEINHKIMNIKASAAEAIQTVDTIINDVTEIDEVTNQIAAAVEEQNVATQEISRNVQNASTGTAEVAQSIVGVLRAGERSSEATSELKRSSDELATQAHALSSAVGDFLKEVRS